MNLEGTISQSYQGDAGTVRYERDDPVELWEIRYRIGKMLSERAPKYKRSLVGREMPKWDVNRLPDIGYVRPAPEVESYKPDCDTFRPR